MEEMGKRFPLNSFQAVMRRGFFDKDGLFQDVEERTMPLPPGHEAEFMPCLCCRDCGYMSIWRNRESIPLAMDDFLSHMRIEDEKHRAGALEKRRGVSTLLDGPILPEEQDDDRGRNAPIESYPVGESSVSAG